MALAIVIVRRPTPVEGDDSSGEVGGLVRPSVVAVSALGNSSSRIKGPGAKKEAKRRSEFMTVAAAPWRALIRFRLLRLAPREATGKCMQHFSTRCR